MYFRFAFALGAIFCVLSAAGMRPPAPAIAVGGQPARFLSQYDWTLDANWFGGFSGIEVTEDGKSFSTITDQSHFVRGAFIRNGDKIIGVNIDEEFALLDTDGLPIHGNRSDAEGLAFAPDGRIYVSFEMLHRVFVFDQANGVPDWAAHHLDFDKFIKNGSLEALAVDGEGRLYTLPETVRDQGRDFPVYRHQREGGGQFWDQPFTIPQQGRFAPVGADFGPDGRFYLLERDVYPFGFRSRIRVFQIDGDTISGGLIALETPLGRHGNLEGLSVWRDAAGHIRLTMIADDNFLPVQSTQIVEYVLKE